MAHRSMLLWEGETAYWTNDYVIGLDAGFYPRGITRSYTALTTGRYSGNTNIVLNGKTDAHVNACVQDERTGLMWNKAPSGSVGPASNGLLYWDDHLIHIDHGGTGASFIQYEIVTQAGSGATGVVRYLSDTYDCLDLFNVTGAFDLINNITGADGGGPEVPSAVRIGIGDDIFAYCYRANFYGLSGYDDWRVPNIYELVTLMIIDSGKGNAKPDTTYFTFPGTTQRIWSSSTMGNGEARAAFCQFSTGSTAFESTALKGKYTAYVYLVRGPDLTSARVCLPLKTGCNALGDNGFADDAFYQNGEAKSYEVLDDGQYKPTAIYNANSGDIVTWSMNCVYDNNTGLMWSKEITDDSMPWWDNNQKRLDAMEVLRLVNENAYAGYSDWRLPSIFELLSIWTGETFKPDTDYFSDESNYVWSSTPRPDNTSYSFRAISTGGIWGGGQPRTTTGSYLRFVRGGYTDEDL